MIGTSKDTKEYFEKLLQDEWCGTPIHFVGEEFDQDNTKRWINPYYAPTYGEQKGFSGGTAIYGTFYVACWAENDLEAMTLSDTIIQFMSTNVDTRTYRIPRYSIEDHGWHKTNKVFVTVAFSIETLGGSC